ncbi:class E sortase [Leucobacter sp. USHLN153]|uniref:class E sortase n=1 Tax=Leucobacter sp. USHLN153 TaxID=3081268 RepID=UPI003018721F
MNQYSRPRRRRRARLSVLTVVGELLLTVGLIVFGYMVWQPWHTAVGVTAKQEELSAEDSAAWDEQAPEDAPWDGVVPVVDKPADFEVFAVLRVPSFGTTYANRVAEKTDWETVLNLDDKGIGHYETTQMPGEPGNFALAGHRSGPLINAFREVMNLRVGDPLFLETPEGWYTYRFRSIEYVLPDETDVLRPFPRLDGSIGEDQILTLTTCHPKLAGSDERAIAYSVFEGYQPRSEGPPAELLKLNPSMEATQALRGDQE